MQITESLMTFEAYTPHLRTQAADGRASRFGDAKLRVDEPRPAQAVVGLNRLDMDRDGWLDEDDIPYDQLMRLAAEQAQTRDHAELQQLLHARPEERLEAEVQPQAVPPAQTQPGAGSARRIDLFA